MMSSRWWHRLSCLPSPLKRINKIIIKNIKKNSNNCSLRFHLFLSGFYWDFIWVFRIKRKKLTVIDFLSSRLCGEYCVDSEKSQEPKINKIRNNFLSNRNYFNRGALSIRRALTECVGSSIGIILIIINKWKTWYFSNLASRFFHRFGDFICVNVTLRIQQQFLHLTSDFVKSRFWSTWCLKNIKKFFILYFIFTILKLIHLIFIEINSNKSNLNFYNVILKNDYYKKILHN